MEDLAVKTTNIKRMYEVMDNARRKQGLRTPYYRNIKVFEPTKRNYRIMCNGISLYMVGDRMQSDDETYQYMRYATVIGDGRTVYAVYYNGKDKAVKASYAGELGLEHRCVVNNYYEDEV